MPHSPLFRSVFCVFLLLSALVLSMVVPPLQSPDEGSHLGRAYFLANGEFFLHTPEGAAHSGGEIDRGWLGFDSVFSRLRFQPDQKVSAADVALARSAKHERVRSFSAAPGVGYYFPAIYLPQAVALYLGERLDFTIYRTYMLARLFVAVAVVVMLYAALRLYPVNPFALGLLVLPMSLFQLASCSLDALSYGVAILALCLFMKIHEMRQAAPERYFWGLAALLFLMGATRLHMLPLLSLLPCAWLYTRRKRHLVISAGVIAGVLAWTLLAAAMTVDARIAQGASKGTIVLHYLQSPVSFFRVLGTTLGSADTVTFYYQSFIGNMGWLDTPLHRGQYSILLFLLAALGVLSFRTGFLREQWRLSLFLAANVLLSVLMVFFAMLTTWTPHPATLIAGVQGRYFLLPLLVFAFALGPAARAPEGEARRSWVASGRALAGCGVLSVFAAYGLAVTLGAVVARYYLHP